MKKSSFLCSLNLNCQATEQKACTFHKQNFFDSLASTHTFFQLSVSQHGWIPTHPPETHPTMVGIGEKKFFLWGVTIITTGQKTPRIRTEIIASTFQLRSQPPALPSARRCHPPRCCPSSTSIAGRTTKWIRLNSTNFL